MEVLKVSRKVYHVFDYVEGNERFLATFTNKEKARQFAIENHDNMKKYEQYEMTIVTSYDLETHYHLDIWFSDMIIQQSIF